MNTLQFALLFNGIFSLSSGLFLIFFRARVAQWFGREKSLVFLIIGIGLLYFSYSIIIQLKDPELDAVFFIIVQDLIWVLASIILLSIRPFNITVGGNQIIAGVAFLVLLFAIAQAVGLLKADAINNEGMKRLSYERIVNASKQSTWEIVADVANYHKVASNIDNVEIISGEREGMVRSCSHNTDSWTEVCTQWNEGEAYSFLVNTDAEEYPYPLNYLKGSWKVEKVSDFETKIVMTFEFRYKHKMHNILIHPFMKKQFGNICEDLLDNWEEKLEKN